VFSDFGDPLKKHMDSKRFVTDFDVKQAVPFSFQTLQIHFLYAWKQSLLLGWDEYLSASGDYMGVWCVSSAAHVKTSQSEQSSRHQNFSYCNYF